MISTADVLQALNGEAFIKKLCPEAVGPNARGEVRVRCIFPPHVDASPSLDFNVNSKTYRCLGCNATGSAVDFFAQKLGRPRHDVLELLARELGVGGRSIIAPELVEEYHQALRANQGLLAELMTRKGITTASVEKFRLGWVLKEKRLAIPIRDEHGSVVNVRRYDLLKLYPEEKKYLNIAGHGQLRLFPMEALLQPEIHLVEGELKMIALRQRNINAITATGGAAGWEETWDRLFEGRVVNVCYDIDATGRARARAYARRLLKAGVKIVRDVLLPLKIEEYKHGGIDDYFTKAGYQTQDYLNLVAGTPAFDPAKFARPEVDPIEYPTTLGSASKAQYYLKRVLVPVIVSAKDTAPYIAPRKLRVDCTRDLECCAGCPVYGLTEENEWTLDADNPDLLKLVDVTAKQQEVELREIIGIPKKCTASELISMDTHNLEEVRLVPQVNTAPDAPSGGEQVVTRAFHVGHGIETNATYAVHAKAVVDPVTQHATLLVHQADPNVDNLSSFSPSEAELSELRTFQPAAWTTDGLDAKLDELYRDLETNVTRIYQRRELHVLMDLVWHSALYITLGQEPVKGWVDALVIGDSGQGKSETALRLLRHYKLGERVDMKGASVAGLKGGLQETHGRRWFVTWGVIPLNDRRMCVLEEVKGCPPEVLQALTDMRSSGIAELVKIERRRAHARTRLLWISNPRSDRKVETYSFGVQTIKELMGSLEDVRRFDCAIVVASNEVPQKVIAEAEMSTTIVPHRHTSELCQRLVLWAWSRAASKVVMDPAARAACVELSVSQGDRYSSAIPLVEPADHRFKLARMATALAARTFSTDDGVTLRVRECHVRWIASWLDRVYSSRFVGYSDFSQVQKWDGELSDVNEVRLALTSCPYADETVRGLLRANEVRTNDFTDLTGLDKEPARELLAKLVRANALQRKREGYYKTGAFIELLKQMSSPDAPVIARPADDF